MKKITLVILILTLLLFSGCIKIKKGVGQPCVSNEECKNYKCVNGLCDYSDRGQYCGDSSVCRGGLICRENICIEPPALCVLNDYSDIIFWVGFFMVLVLIASVFFRLPFIIFQASVMYGRISVTGYALIMIICLVLGWYLKTNCF